MPQDYTPTRTTPPGWGRERLYPAPEAGSGGANDEMMPNDMGQPLFGTRLGLRRAYLSDGRFVVEGRLTGRRIG